MKVAGLVQFFSGLVQFHEVGLVKVAGLVQFFRKQEGGIVGHVWDRFGSNGRFVDPQAPGRSACCRASASRRSKVIPWKSCWAQADAKLFRTNPLSGVGLKEGQTDPHHLVGCRSFFLPPLACMRYLSDAQLSDMAGNAFCAPICLAALLTLLSCWEAKPPET